MVCSFESFEIIGGTVSVFKFKMAAIAPCSTY